MKRDPTSLVGRQTLGTSGSTQPTYLVGGSFKVQVCFLEPAKVSPEIPDRQIPSYLSPPARAGNKPIGVKALQLFENGTSMI